MPLTIKIIQPPPAPQAAVFQPATQAPPPDPGPILAQVIHLPSMYWIEFVLAVKLPQVPTAGRPELDTPPVIMPVVVQTLGATALFATADAAPPFPEKATVPLARLRFPDTYTM